MTRPQPEGPDVFGREYLQRRILAEFPLAVHIGAVVESAADAALVLRAPLAPNSNHQDTAFGGSLFSVAVLAGWAWLTRHLAMAALDAHAVIQESTMRYLAPVRHALHATLEAPRRAELEKFDRMMARAGRGRIRLRVVIEDGGEPAAQFEGLFVATVGAGAARPARMRRRPNDVE